MDRKDVFVELRTEYAKDVILESFLNAVIAFLVANGLISIFTTSQHNIIAALGIASIYLVGLVIYNTRKYYVDLFENRVPELKEALRTAYETAEQHNPIVDQLFDDVREKLRKTSSGNIISVRSVVTKMTLIVLVSFASISAHLVDVNAPQIQLGGSSAGEENGPTPTTPNVRLREDSDIYGEQTVIQHEGKQSLELQVQSFQNMVGNKEKDQESRTKGYGLSEDIEGTAQNVYKNAQVDDFAIIKKYNAEVRERVGE